MKDTGILILNLGSPDSPQVSDVKKYLREFLMDGRVIDAPYLIRALIVEGFILPTRPKKSAHAYASVWTNDGPPLKVFTQAFVRKLETEVELPIAVAMRYGNPTPASALKELAAKCDSLKQLFIAPMYPHYAMSSYETALIHVQEELKKNWPSVKVKVLKPFYNEKDYIKSVAQSIKPYIEKDFDQLLFSYHGLPVRHLKKSDTTNKHCYTCVNCCDVPSPAWDTCYKHQVTQTSHLVAKELALDKSKYAISFQSRLGRDEWILPATVDRLENLPKEGVKKLLIVCPAFVADCLETVEEIAIAGKETFLNAGGESFQVIPCLNDFDPWVKTFASYCNKREKEQAHLWA
jgi:protoporphyrin/coproporphyrin ferrochelatase